MEFSKDFIEKIKDIDSVDDVIKIAKENGLDLDKGMAEKAMAMVKENAGDAEGLLGKIKNLF